MIREENIEELLRLLDRIGFPNSDIEQRLREQIALNIPEFSLDYVMPFGEEKMFFTLGFSQDFENNTIRLQECAAIHQSAVQIDNVVINDIQTSELEGRMQSTDWKSYFANVVTDDSVRNNIQTILNDLWKLSFNENKEGKEIQQKLIYKYLPESKWNDDIKRLSYSFQSYVQTENDFNNWSVHLSYMQLSGRIHEIENSLAILNLNDIYADGFRQLYRDIAAGKQEFELKFSFNQPDGLSDISIPVRYSEDEYSIDTYTVERTIYPEIEHGVYNYVDTKLLEEQMQQINWRDDVSLFIFKEDEEPALQPHVALVSEQLFHLSQDLVGADIADLLQLKYFIGVTFFEDNIHQAAWDKLDELPKRTVSFHPETLVREAVNLVAERAVLVRNTDIQIQNNSIWQQYVFDEDNKYHHTELINDFPVKTLEQQLRMLMTPAFLQNVISKLLSGEMADAISYTGNKVFIQADPANKILRIFDENKKEIAFNFNLDAEWRPKQNAVYYQRVSTAQRVQETKPAKKKPKRKGPKL